MMGKLWLGMLLVAGTVCAEADGMGEKRGLPPNIVPPNIPNISRKDGFYGVVGTCAPIYRSLFTKINQTDRDLGEQSTAIISPADAAMEIFKYRKKWDIYESPEIQKMAVNPQATIVTEAPKMDNSYRRSTVDLYIRRMKGFEVRIAQRSLLILLVIESRLSST